MSTPGVRFGYVAADGGVCALPLRREGEDIYNWLTRLSIDEIQAFRRICRDIGMDRESVFQAMAVRP